MAGRPRRAPAVGALLALAALLLTAPRPAAAVSALQDPATATDLTAPLVAALALLAWLLAGWLLLTAGLTLLARLPGGAGRTAAAVVRRVAPAAVRRLVAAALGVSVVTATLAATPAAAAPASPSASTSAAAAPALDWPSAGPELDWPAVPPAPAPPVPTPPLDWPGDSPTAPVLGAPTSSGQAADAVVVQPGDSLWGLAEQQLAQDGAVPTDAAVAAAWPAWWSANRDVVGDDPDLLLPGTTLQPPGAPAGEPPDDGPA